MTRAARTLAFLVLLVAWVLAPVAGLAQGGEPVVESEPGLPTVNQPVTIFFNADQGNQGLQDFTGDVYAHTGVFTDQSPTEWTCVKNYWPTDPNHTGNRTDTRLEQVEPNRYKLEIADIRAFYNDNDTGCTLGANETIQSMNFVFRSADGSQEGKTATGGDIIVEVGDADADVLVSFTAPTVTPINPFVTNENTTVTVTAEASAPSGTLESIELFVNGSSVESTTTASTLQYDLVLDTPGRFDLEVVATEAGGATASDAFYAVRTEPVNEQAVPAGLQDGINYTSTSTATLVLRAPGKEFVHLVGEFTDWEVTPNFQMNKDAGAPNGARFWIELDGLTAGEEVGFQYLVDGDIRIADPYAEKVLSTNDRFISDETYPNLKPYPEGQTEQLVSVLETGQTPFNFSSFERPEQKDLVIYELLVRDFIEAHDYETMVDTLDYLDRLGVNAIELMPVSEFDGNQSWGYNPAMYFAPDKYYGPEEDLKQFIDEAHQRGIAIILDVVYNHQTGQSPFIRLYNEGTFGSPTAENPWANPEARHPFNVFYDNNHESALTKLWLDRVNEHWLTEYNVDGFRFDLSKGFTQTNTLGDVGAWGQYDQSRVDLLTRMADEIWTVDDRAYIILEHFAETSEEQELASYRTGEGLPGMMLWNNQHGPYNQVSMGYASNSDISGTYYQNRGLSVPNYVSYMESHDEQWMMYNNIAFGNSSGDYDVTQLETALERQQAVGALFFTVPGPRLMWQFGELGYGYGDNGEQCLRGDDCPSNAPGRTDEKPIRWDYRDPAQSPNRVKLYNTWSAMIGLRTGNEVFTSTDTQVDMQVGSGSLVKRIGLSHSTMDAIVIGNYDVQEQEVTTNFPSTGTWYDFFTGQELNIEAFEQNASVTMAPGEFHIFTSEPVSFPTPGLVPFGPGAPGPEAPSSFSVDIDIAASAVDLSWTASGTPDVIAHQIYRGTSADFDTTGALIATVGPNAATYTDGSVELGPTYYYKVAARDNDGVQSDASDEISAFLYPETLTVSTSRSFGQGSRQQDYRLIALPGDIQQGLGGTFTGTAGEQWQAYRDDGSNQDFLVEFDGSSAFDFAPGRGFWAIADSEWSVDREVQTVNLRTGSGGTFATIPLQQGWNIISNPLDRDVDWSAVQNANTGTIQPIWRFDGSFGQASTFASATGGEAFYFNNSGNLGGLVVPYTTGGRSTTLASAGTDRPWTTLAARVAGGTSSATSRIEVGASDAAEDSIDPSDVIAPPHTFEALSLLVREEDAEAGPRQRQLKRSVRKDGAAGYAFDLMLHADPGTTVALRLDGTPDAEAVRLVNPATGESTDLLGATETEITVRSDETPLTLLTGSRSFVDAEAQRLVPDELTFWPNYPNPFGGSTTIEYTIPEPSHVTLEVYDILGRRVATLVDQKQRSGLHTMQWDGTGGAGQPLASGIYFGRIRVDGQTATRKLTIVR